MNVFELFAKIGLDTSEYDKGLDDSEKKASSFGSKLGGVLKGGTIAFGAGLAVVSGEVVALTANMTKNVSELAQYGDSIDKSSQKLGVSSKFYQEWEAVMQHSGTSMGNMTASFKTLSNAVQNTSNEQAEAFEKLGLSLDDLAGMNTEDVFTSVIYALQDMEEGTERTALASTLLGRGAMEMGALLNTSAEDTQKMIDTVNELGGVLSDDAVKDSAKYQDTLQDMQTSITGLKNNMIANFLPSVTMVMDGLTAIFSGNDSGLGKINEGVDDFVGNLADKLPQILTTGTKIVESIASAIIENIPKLVDTATQIVLELGTFIIQNLPMLVETALQVILSLANGIAEALPTLIPTIVDVVLSIVETLIDNVDLLIDGAIALILGLTEGLINAIPIIIEKLPEIVIKIVEALIENAPKLIEAGLELIVQLVIGIANALVKLYEVGKDIIEKVKGGISAGFTKLKERGAEIIGVIKNGIMEKIEQAKTWGKDLIDNFVQGIKDKIGAVKDAVTGVADKIKSFLGFSEPEAGPLSNFHTYAPDMMKLFAQGIKDNEDLVTDQIEKSFDFGDRTIKAVTETDSLATTSVGSRGDLVGALTEAFKEALDGFEIDWNGRELGRLIQRYA